MNLVTTRRSSHATPTLVATAPRPQSAALSFSKPLLKALIPVLVVAWLLTTLKHDANAVPSYSRQTGLSCAVCHFAPPELTPFGRKFKLDGYVFATKPEVAEDKKDHNSALHILEAFPLSAVFDVSFSNTKSPQPGTQNGNFQIPQDISLFLAGRWSDHVGSFAQVTYDSRSDHFSWDNTDVRYANNRELFGKTFAYGATFNNNPGVEDLWHSSPAWGFPFTNSSAAPRPSAGALVNGGLAQGVAGVGAYSMWNEHLYVAGTIYRSQHIGSPQPTDGVGFGINIRGVAPYWRVAWQASTKNNYLEVGTFGLHAKSTPNGVTGLMDSFTDYAADFQYERTIPQWKNDVVTVRGSYIRENSSLVATFAGSGANFPRHHLNTLQANAEYHYGTKLSGTVGFFNINGTPDPALFPQAPVSGSANGDPRSAGYILNLSYWPVQNIDLAVQYTGYTRFNGLQTNYDGTGRNASSNNTVFLLARFVF